MLVGITIIRGNSCPFLALSRFALRTLRELKLLVYWAQAGVSENVRARSH